MANPPLSPIADVTKARKGHLDCAVADRNGIIADSGRKRWTL